MEDIAEEEQEQEQETSSEEEDYWFHCSVDEPVGPSGRSGHDTEAQKWRDSTVIYEFDSSFEREDRGTFHVAVRQIEQATCVRFKERSVVGGSNYRGPVTLIERDDTCIERRGRGCFSGGSVSPLGESTLSSLKIKKFPLNPKSQQAIGLVIHELLHVLGMVHTQKRRDRNETITILYENILPDRYSRYQYEPCDHCETYGTKYDCMSIMHYRSCAASVNKQECLYQRYLRRTFKPTMVPKESISKCDLISYNFLPICHKQLFENYECMKLIECSP